MLQLNPPNEQITRELQDYTRIIGIGSFNCDNLTACCHADFEIWPWAHVEQWGVEIPHAFRMHRAKNLPDVKSIVPHRLTYPGCTQSALNFALFNAARNKINIGKTHNPFPAHRRTYVKIVQNLYRTPDQGAWAKKRTDTFWFRLEFYRHSGGTVTN